MYTFIIALNDEYEGGETVFPNIRKQYRLEKAPVKSGEKWICNLWVRMYRY